MLRRVDRDPAVADRVAGRLGQRADLDQPLQGQARLDGGLAARAVPDGVHVRAASRRRSGPARAAPRRSPGAPRSRSRPWNGPVRGDDGALVHDREAIGRSWRRPISKSLGSCAGVTLTAPVPNSGSTCSSATTGMRAAGQRQLDLGADQVRVPLVVGVDGDGGVAEHRLGAGGGDHDGSSPVAVADRDQLAVVVAGTRPRCRRCAVRQRGHQLMMRSAR